MMARAASQSTGISLRAVKRSREKSIRLAEETASELSRLAISAAYSTMGDLNAHRNAVANMAAAQLQAAALIYAVNELAAAIRDLGAGRTVGGEGIE